MSKKAIIIGSGIAGIAASIRLALKCLSVGVIEAIKIKAVNFPKLLSTDLL